MVIRTYQAPARIGVNGKKIFPKNTVVKPERVHIPLNVKSQ